MIEKQTDKIDDTLSEEVFAYICAYNQQHGYPPSVRNIAASCYMARSSAHQQLYRLEAKGWITREPGRARGITILRKC